MSYAQLGRHRDLHLKRADAMGVGAKKGGHLKKPLWSLQAVLWSMQNMHVLPAGFITECCRFSPAEGACQHVQPALESGQGASY